MSVQIGNNSKIRICTGGNVKVIGAGGATLSSSGTMSKVVYDPQNIESDAFARENHTGVPTFSTYTEYTATSAPTYTKGRVWYDNQTNALSYYDNHSGTSIQLGKETVIEARNNTGVQINNGQVVYVSGASGNHPTVSLAQANALNTSHLIGVATHNIANNATGKITIIGIVNDLDTSAFGNGDTLYLSAATPGALTNTPPASPNYIVEVGHVVYSHASNGQLLVHVGTPIANNNNLGSELTVAPTQASTKTYIDTNLAEKLSNTGWADYVDTIYTSASPFSITGGIAARLPNNRGAVIDSQKPAYINDFYVLDSPVPTPAVGTITGRNGDAIAYTVDLKARPTSVTATYLEMWIDIGGSVGELYKRIFTFPKGSGIERPILATTEAYTLNTWETNGGQIWVGSDGPVEIYDIRFVVFSVHRAN